MRMRNPSQYQDLPLANRICILERLQIATCQKTQRKWRNCNQLFQSINVYKPRSLRRNVSGTGCRRQHRIDCACSIHLNVLEVWIVTFHRLPKTRVILIRVFKSPTYRMYITRTKHTGRKTDHYRGKSVDRKMMLNDSRLNPRKSYAYPTRCPNPILHTDIFHHSSREQKIFPKETHDIWVGLINVSKKRSIHISQILEFTPGAANIRKKSIHFSR